MKILLLLLFLLPACQAAEIHEADNNQKFSSIIGKTFLSQTELSMHDISAQDASGRFRPRYTITNMPGVAGREIRSTKILPTGTSISVNAVYTCMLCSLLKNEQLVVTLVGDEKYKDARIEMHGILGIDLILYENSKAFLNPKFFELKE